MNEVPTHVLKRLNGWFYSFWGFTICHYLFGIAGVLCSTIAAASTGDAVKVFSVIASGCMAFVGFVQPDRQYRKYVIAWRLLDEKVNLYRHGLIEIRELLEGMAGAERALDQIERDTSNTKPGSNPVPGQSPPSQPTTQPARPNQTGPAAPSTQPPQPPAGNSGRSTTDNKQADGGVPKPAPGAADQPKQDPQKPEGQ